MKELSQVDKKRLSVCYITFIFSGIMALSIGSIMPFLREERGFSYAFSGLLVSAHSIGNFLSSFFSGIIASKFGRKKTIVFFEIFPFLAYFLIAFTSNDALLLPAFIMTGVGRGAISNFSNKTVNDISKGNTLLLNLLHAMFGIGAFLFPLIMLLATKNKSTNYIYVVYFIVLYSLINLILFISFPEKNKTSKENVLDLENDVKGKTEANIKTPESKNDTNKNSQELKINNSQKETIKSDKVSSENKFGFLKEKDFYLGTLTLFFYLCAEQGTIGWLISYFKDTGFLPSEYSQLSSSLQWLMILFGRLTVAYLSTRVSIKKIYRIMGLGFFGFCLLLLFSRTPLLILIGIAGFGFSMAGIYPTTVSLSGDVIKSYDLCWSFMLTLASLGSILMPSIIGYVANNFGIVTGMTTIVFVIVIDLILIFIKSFKIK